MISICIGIENKIRSYIDMILATFSMQISSKIATLDYLQLLSNATLERKVYKIKIAKEERFPQHRYYIDTHCICPYHIGIVSF